MSLTQIAETILANAKVLEEHGPWSATLESGSLDVPSLQRRNDLIDAVEEMHAQILSPIEFIRVSIIDPINKIQLLRFLSRYNVAALIPDTPEGIPLAKLAASLPHVDASVLARYVRAAISMGLFAEEPAPGFVSHTARSRPLTDPDTFAMFGFLVDEHAGAAVHAVDALDKCPAADDPRAAGFNVAMNTSDHFFANMAKDPAREHRVTGAFRAVANMVKQSAKGLPDWTTSRLWKDVDAPGKVLVDVGGSMGKVSFELAGVTKDLQFVVEDLPGTVARGEREAPNEMRARVGFKAYDFFKEREQPVKGADVYFIRAVLHDWPDAMCVRILKGQVPALREGAKVVLCERILPDRTRASWVDRRERFADLLMMCIQNGRERTKNDWRELFAQVDERFHVEFEEWPLQDLGLVVATWKPGA